MNVVMSLKLGKKVDTHMGENDVNVFSPPSSSLLSAQECVSYDVNISLYNSPSLKGMEDPKEGDSFDTVDSTLSNALSPKLVLLWLLSLFLIFLTNHKE